MSTVAMTHRENGTGFAKNRVSKVQQHDWKIKDQPGLFRMIPKGQLNIDHEYQRREISQGRLSKIRQAWSWVGCGVLTVAQRPDGSYWVIDGQHRKLAADERVDVQVLPCLVFQADYIDIEAKGFLDSNTVRGPVRAVSKFSAMIIAKDECAMAVKEMVEADGYRIDASAAADFTVGCVATLMQEMARNASVARRVWNLCVELYAGKPPIDRVYSALCFLENTLLRRASGETIFDSHNRKTLLAAGPDAIKKSITNAVGYYGKGGPKVYAQGVVHLLNHRRSTRRLVNILD